MREILIIVGGVLFVLFFAVALICLLAHLYYAHVKKRGYKNPLMMLIVGVPPVVGFLVGGVLVLWTHAQDDPTRFTALLLASTIAFTLVAYITVRLLPTKRRVAGARSVRFPFGTVGWSLLLGGAVHLLVSGFLFDNFQLPLRWLVQVELPLSLGCFYLARRSRASSAAEVLISDERAPVLYLRSFQEEEHGFVTLPRKEVLKYTSFLGTKTGVTIEQYLSNAIQQQIGPFVALGDPLDYVPPEGAARVYESDDDWKAWFVDLARRASCIIIQPGDSQGLQWEFATLRRESLMHKIFIVTSPSVRSMRSNAWYRFWDRVELKVAVLVDRLKGGKSVSWKEFAEGLRAVGYHLELLAPRGGSILTFDTQGVAALLSSNAKEPSDYVTAIRKHLEEILPRGV